MSVLDLLFGNPADKLIKKCEPDKEKVLALESVYAQYTDSQLKSMTDSFKKRLEDGESTDSLLPEAYAVCREASKRVISLQHFPVQVLGGIVLHKGAIAEMKTGEGKTLVETLPAYLNALTGKGVHIVTVNEYLARRDSEWMGKVFNFLGLSVGLIYSGMDQNERKQAYLADITYGTNSEFGFDYLRDNMVTSLDKKVQRGHAFAIVDEVDSILIDEARTPLIISGGKEEATDLYKKADDFVRSLRCEKIIDHDDKEELESANADYIVDQKKKSCSLTSIGIEKAQRYFGVDNLADPENMTLSHHIEQAIRARGLMERDVDYVVQNGQVLIVDSFTGRLMIGRRFANGLHQAIEAKEHVHVEREDRTMATITYQNYFRMYSKLSGMTGTALTEKDEFLEIYGLNVIPVPTNLPVVRQDHPDTIFKTQKGKYAAVVEQVMECHSKGQPVLVGTVSVEKSELISKMLSAKKIPHNVLNAKYHEKEAYIIAQAGKLGAVTIATNMAGRGTDIMLGGNPEFLARTELSASGFSQERIDDAVAYFDTDKQEILEDRALYSALLSKYKAAIAEEAERVKSLGGLYIVGTERHESRRIDDQLRGRSGRQGDPGESRFFISFEDDLMKLFGGERCTALMEAMGADDSIQAAGKMISGLVETCQRRVEGNNFATRKNVINYDDIMNHQRSIIYSQRDMVLEGTDISQKIRSMMEDSIRANVAVFLNAEKPEDWNTEGLRGHYLKWLTTNDDFRFTTDVLETVTSDEVADMLVDRAMTILQQKEERIGSEYMRVLERYSLLTSVDSNWMEHIDNMDQLRKAIHLRSYAQRDPLLEYRLEGFAMFDDMIEQIKEDTTKKMIVLTVAPSKEAARTEAEARKAGTDKAAPVRKKKIGPNDPCPCGSGLKYKKCCGKNPSRN